MKETIAVIADIHGNSWALDKVIEDIQQRGITNVINLGDILYGPLDPKGTAERIIALGTTLDVHTIRGNQDRAIYQHTDSDSPSPTLEYVRTVLTHDQKRWLETLPAAGALNDEIFLCHGTPDSDETYLLEAVSQHGVSLRHDTEIEALLKDIGQTIVLCGHTHLPRVVFVSGSRTVVNPGSVGLQAYTDESPYPHSMEAGSPHARYAIISKNSQSWNVQHVSVPYEWEKAAQVARRNGREDWAAWLLTGRA
jgi:predicted phosphodiesterase